MIYIILAALAVGLSLGLFGSGGSILTVPALIYLLHHEDTVAIAESLAIVGSIALIIVLPYAKARLVDWRLALRFGLPGMAGTYLGAWLAAFVPGYVQLFVFAGVMVLAAIQMWRKSKTNVTSPQQPAAAMRSNMKIGIDGLAVGILTGFVGVGGGFLIVPALVLLAGLTMRQAVATSLLIIAMNSAIGLIKHLNVLNEMGTFVDLRTVGLFIAVGVIGSFIGKRLSDKLPQRAMQRGFAVFLILMAGFILVKETTSLIALPV